MPDYALPACGQRVLFSLPAGAGLGRLNRGLTIAGALRAVDDSVEQFILSESADGRLADDAGIPYLLLPPNVTLRETGPLGPWSALSTPLRSSLWEALVSAVITTFRPTICVHDTYLLPHIQQTSRALGAVQVLIMRRSRWTTALLARGTHHPYKDIDLILVPHNQADHGALTLPGVPPQRIIYTGDLVRRSRSELQPDIMRTRYQIHKDDFTVVATNGGGNQREQDAFLDVVVTAIELLAARLPRLRLILIAGPLVPSDAVPVPRSPRVLIREYEPRLADLFAAANLVISRAGYNTINELMEVGVPAIAIPVSPANDDQGQRIARVRQQGAAIHQGTLDAVVLARDIESIAMGPEWTFDPLARPDDAAHSRKLAAARSILDLRSPSSSVYPAPPTG